MAPMKALQLTKALKVKSMKHEKVMKAMRVMKAKADQRLVGRRVKIVGRMCGQGWVGTVIAVSGSRYEIDLDKAWHSERGCNFVDRRDFKLLPK